MKWAQKEARINQPESEERERERVSEWEKWDEEDATDDKDEDEFRIKINTFLKLY